jgi:hypothetical protein
MGFSINQVINTKKQAIPVKNLGVKQIVKSSSATLAALGETVILDTASGLNIDEFVWSTDNYTNFRIRIFAYISGVETGVTDITYNGSGVIGFYPGQLLANGSSLFDVVEYDTVNLRFKFRLKKALNFAEGVKITVSNTSTANPAKYAIMLLGREYD